MFAAAALSRYCSKAFEYPVSTSEPGAFVESVLEFVRAQAIDLVIPITDWTLGPLSAQRERFAEVSGVAMPSREAFEFASDKYRTIQLAESIGIGVPKTLLVASAGDLSQFQSSAFPVVVKDRFSVRWTADKAVFGSVSYAYSAEELQGKVAERVQAAGDVLVQEFAAGLGLGFSCFMIGGKAFLPFQWQRNQGSGPSRIRQLRQEIDSAGFIVGFAECEIDS